jgi:hypothetical protein
MRIGNLLRASIPVASGVGINVVPISGFVFGGWPPATMMVVYLVESCLVALVVALRIRLFAPMQLVQANGTMQHRKETIGGFLAVALGFSLVGTILSSLFLYRLIDFALTQQALVTALASFAIVQGISLLADLVLRGDANSAMVDRWMLPGLRRGCLIFGAVFLGFFVAIYDMAAFIYPFVALKLFFDVGGALEEATARWRSSTTASADLLGSIKKTSS